MGAWSADEAGLPVYSLIDLQTAITECRKQARAEDQARLRLGAVASTVSRNRVYGENNLRGFSREAGIEYKTLADHKRVYERLAELEISERSEILEKLQRGSLYYSWLLVVAAVEGDAGFVEILKQARSTAHARELAGLPLHQQHVQKLAARDEAEIVAAEQAEKREQPPEIERGEEPARLVRQSAVQLLYGDCLQVLDQIEKGSVDAIISDIPYGTKNEGGFGAANHGQIANDESPIKAIEFLTQMLAAASRVVKPDAHLLLGVSGKIRISADLMRVIDQAGWRLTPIPIVWDKTRGAKAIPGEPYQRHYELWLHARRGKPKKWPHSGHGDVLRYPAIPGPQRLHHHQKPLGLMVALLDGFVPRGGCVLDPCVGSGSTLVAADLLGLNAYGIEVDIGHYQNADKKLQRVQRAPESLRQKWLKEAQEPRSSPNAEVSRGEVMQQMLAALDFDCVQESTLRAKIREANLTDEERIARGEIRLIDWDWEDPAA